MKKKKKETRVKVGCLLSGRALLNGLLMFFYSSSLTSFRTCRQGGAVSRNDLERAIRRGAVEQNPTTARDTRTRHFLYLYFPLSFFYFVSISDGRQRKTATTYPRAHLCVQLMGLTKFQSIIVETKKVSLSLSGFILAVFVDDPVLDGRPETDLVGPESL